jgi:23S rRNA (guanosine2251-2'-O)-methyltransferase
LKPEKHRTEILYGYHPVAEALAAGRRRIWELFVRGPKPAAHKDQLLEQARQRGATVRVVDSSQLKGLAGTALHQDIAARVSPLPLTPLAQALAGDPKALADRIWLLLDNLVDPHNLGAVVRTALCAGIWCVVIPKDRSAPPTPAVSKASAGALEHICLVSVTNLADTLKRLKALGIWVVGLDAAAELSVFKANLKGSLALVVGGEEKGIRPWVKKQCDFLVSIPQFGRVSSLNASVAAGVVIYEAIRQRRGG